jgi:sugar porter (SP) family MFS transporter
MSNGPTAPDRVLPPAYHAGYVWMISLIAALGGLLFGYDWVVIGGAKPFYEKFFGITDPGTQGWAMSCALVGSLLGAAVSGAASDRWGRKRLLLVAAVLFGVSSIATGIAPTFGQFVLWRIVGGAAIGLASNLSPMYIAEVAPAAARGRLVALNQLTIVVGILLAQTVNLLIAQPVPAGATAADILNSWNGQTGWRWMFGVTAVPSALFLIGVLFVPESPRWLVKNGRTADAGRVLARIAGEPGGRAALREIEATLREEHERVDWRALFDPRLRRVLGLGIVLAVFQQWCGINVVFNYAEEIFSAAGYSVSDILFNIVVTGSVNLVFTLVALGTIDRLGRRPLMLFGSAGLAVVYTVLGASYAVHTQGVHVLVLVLAAIGCYAMSLAPVTWVVISEIFPNRVRGLAMSVAVGFLWIACFILAYTFPILNRALGPAGAFWAYAAVCVAGFIFIFFRLPETKGKTLEELEAADRLSTHRP